MSPSDPRTFVPAKPDPLADFTLEERRRLKLLTSDAVAELLGVSSSTVSRLVADRRLPHIKMEGRDRGKRGRAGAVRFRMADVLRFVAEREIAARPVGDLVGARRIAADIQIQEAAS